jgi:uncharacterized cupin superfamily protein
MGIFNLYSDEWDETRDRDGFRIKEVFVGHRIGSSLLGGSMCEVEPGSKMWPYHTHFANEEWALVVRGEPTLRTPEGERVLREGDVVCFRRGEDGAHQIRNDSDAPVQVLMLSTRIEPEIVYYPDTGKMAANDATGEGIMLARRGPTLDYWEGEE